MYRATMAKTKKIKKQYIFCTIVTNSEILWHETERLRALMTRPDVLCLYFSDTAGIGQGREKKNVAQFKQFYLNLSAALSPHYFLPSL